MLVAVAWLPYATNHCCRSQATHAHCHAMSSGAHAASGAANDPLASPQHARHQERQHQCPRTCCDLVGKYAVKAAVAPVSWSCAHVAVETTAGLHVDQFRVGLRRVSAIVPAAHGPPTYLRNLSLLI